MSENSGQENSIKGTFSFMEANSVNNSNGAVIPSV